MFFVSPDDMPEELKAQIEQHQMEHEAQSHEMVRTLTEMDPASMRVMKNLLLMGMSDENSLAYYMGVLTVLIASKENTCLACGKSHDAALNAILEHDKPSDGAPPVTAPPAPSVSDVAPEPEPRSEPPVEGERPKTVVDGKELSDADRTALLELYEVDDHFMLDGRVVCKNCQHISPNLEDRMLRNPGRDGCGTCQLQTKWG